MNYSSVIEIGVCYYYYSYFLIDTLHRGVDMYKIIITNNT